MSVGHCTASTSPARSASKILLPGLRACKQVVLVNFVVEKIRYRESFKPRAQFGKLVGIGAECSDKRLNGAH